MKKTISSLIFIGIFTFGINTGVFAQNTAEDDSSTEIVSDVESNTSITAGGAINSDNNQAGESFEVSEESPSDADIGFISNLKKKFIEGDPFWMGLVLVDLIIGLAICIERIVYLNLSSINTKKFLNDVEGLLEKGDTEAAKELCINTRGPIASIFYQGLTRVDEGIESVEKTVVAYGGVQMGLLEKGISWITLFIALAPMLGFLGTVIGMVFAFEKIVEDGQVSPITVAGGIQVALLTTIFGLLAAIVLQIFYNYIISKMEGIVNEMENASISLVDMLLKYKVSK